MAALIDADRLPDPMPVAAGTFTIQVVDARGRIADVSPDADRLVPSAAARPAGGAAGGSAR